MLMNPESRPPGGLLLLLTGLLSLLYVQCATPDYIAPLPGKETALLKIKPHYIRVREDADLNLRIMIQEGADGRVYLAHQESGGMIRYNRPRPVLAMHGMLIRTGQPTRLQVEVYFHWTTQRIHFVTVQNDGVPTQTTRTVTDHHYRGCPAEVVFTPQAGRVYYLDYTNLDIDRNCRATLYEQVFGSDSSQQFEMQPIAKP